MSQEGTEVSAQQVINMKNKMITLNEVDKLIGFAEKYVELLVKYEEDIDPKELVEISERIKETKDKVDLKLKRFR